LKKFDYAGSILYCIAVTTVLVALAIGDPLSVRNLIILACGIAIFVVVVFVELQQKHPTLDLTLFKIRLFAAGSLTGFMNSLSFSCGPFLRSLYLQLILGYSAAKTGILLIPMEIHYLLYQSHQWQISRSVWRPGTELDRFAPKCLRADLVFNA